MAKGSVGNTSQSGAAASGSSFSWGHTPASGTDHIYIFIVAKDSSQTDRAITGITIDSTEMDATVQVLNDNDTDTTVSVYRVAPPSTGSELTIEVTFNAKTSDAGGYACDLTGYDTTAVWTKLHDYSDGEVSDPAMNHDSYGQDSWAFIIFINQHNDSTTKNNGTTWIGTSVVDHGGDMSGAGYCFEGDQTEGRSTLHFSTGLDDVYWNAIGMEFMPAGATTLVHTDSGEDYCLLADHDGGPIDLGAITLSIVNDEDYLLLDDNDGNPISIQHVLPPVTLVHTDAGEDYCYFDDHDGTPIVLGNITLGHTDAGEDYCLLDDNGGVAITIEHHHILYHTDAGEDYLLHDADNVALPGGPGMFSTDFSEYTTGLQPSDWTERWNTGNCSAVVTADAGFLGGKKLVLASTSDEEQFISWDALTPGENHQQILVRFKYTSTDQQCIRLVLRGSGGAGTETGLVGEINTGASGSCLSIWEYNSGTPTDVSGNPGNALITSLVVGEWYFMRLTVMDNILPKSRAYLTLWDGNSPPPAYDWNDNWPDNTCYTLGTNVDFDETDLSSGWIGIGGYGQDCEVDYVSIAAGTDTSDRDNPLYACIEHPDQTYTRYGVCMTADADYDEGGLNGTRAFWGELWSRTRDFALVGVGIAVGSVHTGQVRMAVYQDDQAYDSAGSPVLGTLVHDFGQTGGSDTDTYIELSCSPIRLDRDLALVVAVKADDSGFYVKYHNPASQAGFTGNFQNARFNCSGFDDDASVAFPTTFPGAAVGNIYTYDIYIILSEINVELKGLDCYHLHDAEGPLTLGFSLTLEHPDGGEDYLLHDADKVIWPDLQVINDTYHLHDADNIEEMSITAWDGGGVPSEGTSGAAKNYRMIVLSSDFDYGDSDGYVRARMVGAPTEAVTIAGASIGQRKAAADAYDYDTTNVLHTRFTFNGGDHDVTIGAGQTVWSDWVPFAIDSTKDHLLHVFVSAAHKYSYRITASCYDTSAGNNQTMMADVSNYSLLGEFLFFTQLEVRPRTAMTGFADSYHLHDADPAEPFSIHRAHHLHDADSAEPLVVVLATTEECYHLLDDNDGSPITVQHVTTNVNLVHTDAGEDYCLLDDNDGAAIKLTEVQSIDHADAGEDYCLLDDNDGAAIDLGNVTLANTEECYHLHDADAATFVINLFQADAGEDYLLHDGETIDLGQHFLNVADCFHLHDVDVVDPFAITLATTEECYHLLDDNDGLAIALTQDHTLAHTEAGEDYLLLNDNDGNPITMVTEDDLPIDGAHHLHDAENIDFEQHFLTTAECHHLHDAENATFGITLIHIDAGEDYLSLDDNDGNPTTLTQLHILTIADDYLLHDGETIDFAQHFLAVADCFHLHDAESVTAFDITLAIAESDHLHYGDNAELIIIGDLVIPENYLLHFADATFAMPGFIVNGAYHEHYADAIALTQDHTLATTDDYLTIASDQQGRDNITITTPTLLGTFVTTSLVSFEITSIVDLTTERMIVRI